MKNITKQNRRRSRVFRHKTRSRTRTRTQTRNSKKTNLRKKNKSRRGSYTKKRKVMVGGVVMQPYDWNQLSEENKKTIINQTNNTDELNTYLSYEENPENTNNTISDYITVKIGELQQSPPPPPPQQPPPPPQQPPPPPQQPPPPPQQPPPPPQQPPPPPPPPQQQPPPPPPPPQQQPPPPPPSIEIHDIPIEEEPIKENQLTPTSSRRVICDCKRRSKSLPEPVSASPSFSSRIGSLFSRNKKNKVNPV